MKRVIKPDDYLELWQYFANRGDSFKDKMWNITIWLYALLTGILGYMASNFTSLATTTKEAEGVTATADPLITEPALAIVFSLFAILFCLYIIVTIKEYGEHIQHNWNRADHLLEQIEGLSEIWYSGISKEEQAKRDEKRTASKAGKKWLKAVPEIPKRLIYLTLGMMLVFKVIGGMSLWELGM